MPEWRHSLEVENKTVVLGFFYLYFHSRTEINDIKKKTDLWFPLIISWNDLIKDPGILSLVIFFINSHKFSFDYVLIMLRENWCWSLLGVKGLNPKSNFHDGALTQSFNSWSLESLTTQLFMELWGGYVRVIFDKRRGIETTTYRWNGDTRHWDGLKVRQRRIKQETNRTGSNKFRDIL